MKPASRLLDDYVEHVFRESQQAKDASAAAKHRFKCREQNYQAQALARNLHNLASSGSTIIRMLEVCGKR